MTKNIKHVIFDVDGVFTSGQFIYDQTGKRYKIFGPHDSDGIKFLLDQNISVEAISADKRGFNITLKRMNDIGLPLTLVSESDRESFVRSRGGLRQLCFMGDGHFDAHIFDIVGYAIAPSNAVPIALEKADYVTRASGGKGAVYEAALHIWNITGKKE